MNTFGVIRQPLTPGRSIATQKILYFSNRILLNSLGEIPLIPTLAIAAYLFGLSGVFNMILLLVKGSLRRIKLFLKI